VTFSCPFDNRYSFTFRKDIFSPGNVQLVDGKGYSFTFRKDIFSPGNVQLVDGRESRTVFRRNRRESSRENYKCPKLSSHLIIVPETFKILLNKF